MVVYRDAQRGRVIAQVVEEAGSGQPRLELEPDGPKDPIAERMLQAIDELFAQAFADPARAVVITRSLAALNVGVQGLQADGLRRAGGREQDRDVLVAALLEMISDNPSTDVGGDPLAGALLRGKTAQAELLQAEGGALGPTEVAKRLVVSRQTINNWRDQGKLLGLETARRGVLYPAWQFAEDGLLPGLERSLATLRHNELGPWPQLLFFLTRRFDLAGQRPLDLLRKGDVEAVWQAAERYGEHGAS